MRTDQLVIMVILNFNGNNNKKRCFEIFLPKTHFLNHYHLIMPLYGSCLDLTFSCSTTLFYCLQNFTSDYSSVARDFDDERKTAMLNEVICEHFLRQGRLNIAENLIQVCNNSVGILCTVY